LHVRVLVVEGSLLERREVAVDGCGVLLEFAVDRGEFVVMGAGGAREVGQELGDCLGDDVVAGSVEVEQGLPDRGLQFVGVEPVDAATFF
jgi:hypothetical protein